ncbi:MAG: M23 family metallopeptidase [Tissierellia bacterium]|nr:M23 family metallopeptidase [Tissierellia bacterium]
MKDKFSEIFKKSGFHIILFVCVSVLAITGVMAARGNFNKKKEDNLSKKEDFVIVSEEEPAMEIAQMEKSTEETDGTEEEEDDQDGDLDFVEEEEPESEPEPEQQEPKSSTSTGEMIAPVDGKLGDDFTKDNLIYSETLEEWTSHNGIDILAQEGQEVKAALSGEVLEVYEDELWGIVAIIDHGNGLMTKYANLSTMEMIKEGNRVEKGTVISKVGNTAAIEMIMEPHIHFEVIKDGVNVDPKDYIPAFSHLK